MLQFLPPEVHVFKGTCYDEMAPLRNYISSLCFATSLKLCKISFLHPKFISSNVLCIIKRTVCPNSSSFDPIFPSLKLSEPGNNCPSCCRCLVSQHSPAFFHLHLCQAPQLLALTPHQNYLWKRRTASDAMVLVDPMLPCVADHSNPSCF